MEVLHVFNIIIWTIVGILNLKSDKIDKGSYALAWAMLMLYIIADCIKDFVA